MDYASLLARTWAIISKHRGTIALGVLLTLGSGGLLLQLVRSFSNLRYVENIPTFPDGLRALMLVDPGLFIILAAALLILTFPLWLISNIARGALVSAAAHDLPLRRAWSDAWRHGWRLFGVGLSAGLPGLITLLITGFYGFVSAYYAVQVNAVMTDTFSGLDSGSALDDLLGFNVLRVLIMLIILCPLNFIALSFQLLQTLADRAVMLEDARVFTAFKRGWHVFWGNQATSIPILFLVLVIWLAVNTLLLIPEAVVSLCCVLWPIMWLLSGTLRSTLSVLWTLAWQEWTAESR